MWFGEFLCRNNVITNEQLIVAMGAYYASREPIGKMALNSGMLTISDINQILREQADDPEPFGKVAVRMGYLVEEQVEMLIGRQSFKESIWEYLVREDYLSKEALESWMVKFHNRSNFVDATTNAASG